MRFLLIVAMLAAVSLAGCTASDEIDAGGNDGMEHSDAAGDVVVGDDRLRVQALAPFVEPVQKIETGSKDPTAGVCSDTSCPRDIYPLLPDMEPGLAYQLEATITWDDSAHSGAAGPAVFLLLVYNSGVRNFDGVEYSDAQASLSALLLAKDADDERSLQVGWNFGGDESADYELTYTLTPIRDRVPAFSTAAVQVPDGGTLIARTIGGESSVTVYDPSDEWVATEALEAPEGAPRGGLEFEAQLVGHGRGGEYVVINQGVNPVRLYVVQDDDQAPLFRHLPVRYNQEELGDAPASGAQQFTFDAAQPLTQLGVAYGGASCVPETCWTAREYSINVVTPDGREVLSYGPTICQICGGTSSIWRGMGDGPYTAGTYAVNWDSEESSNVKVYLRYYVYVR